jgi:hypothetical protein
MSNNIRKYLIYSLVIIFAVFVITIIYNKMYTVNTKNTKDITGTNTETDTLSVKEQVTPIPPGDETVKYELKTIKRNQVAGEDFSGVNIAYPQITVFRSPEITKIINKSIYEEAHTCLTGVSEGREALIAAYEGPYEKKFTDEQLAKMSDTELYLNQPKVTLVTTSDYVYSKHDLFSFSLVFNCSLMPRALERFFSYDLRTGKEFDFGDVFVGFIRDTKYDDIYTEVNTTLFNVLVAYYKKEVKREGQDLDACEYEGENFELKKFIITDTNAISFNVEDSKYCPSGITVPLSTLKPFFKPGGQFDRIK